jgi:hypothetical protein
MKSHLADPEVELLAALNAGNRTSGLAGITQCAAARGRPLGITERLGFVDPRRRFQKPEMRSARRRQQQQTAS